MDMRTNIRLNGEKLGYLQVFIAGSMWGLIGIFVMWMEQCGSSTNFTGFIRTTFACLIMTVFTIHKYGFQALKIDRKTLLGCAVMGIICQGFNCLVYNYAIVTAGVAVSAILLNVSPAFTAIISFFLFSEKITTNKKMAMVINIIGCALAVTLCIHFYRNLYENMEILPICNTEDAWSRISIRADSDGSCISFVLHGCSKN